MDHPCFLRLPLTPTPLWGRRFHQYNGFQRTTPIIYGTGMPPLTSWRGSGYIYNHGNNWPESSSVAVPCGTQLSGGGAWFAVWDLPQTPQTAAGWYLEDGAAWDTASPIAMSANCGAGLFWTPPMPAAAPWNRLSWPDDSAEPYDTECGYASGVGLMKQDTQVMWEQGSQVHVSMPKPGSCAGAPSGTCIAAATKPSSSWCTSAACVSSLFDPVNGQGANYGNLRQLVDSAIGATNPATGNSNPPGLVAIPDCSAMTVSACRSALSAAGFTNTTTSTLTTDEADLTKPAGAVVTTSPSRGTSEDTATAITLNINPDPLPVVVPAIQGNESPGSYTSQITQAGLQSSVTTLAATDTTVADGDVVEAEPQPGTRVAPNSTVDVAVNSDPSKISQQDPRCDVDNGAGAPGSPGNPPSDGTNYPWYQTAPGTQAPYTADVDPTNSSPAQTEIPLRWGTTGWGWTHILIKHPYTTADENQVIEALATDRAPTPTGNTSTNQWDFHYFYDVPDGANDGGSVTCVRTVRVEYWQDSRATNAGVYGIRGIQNTFTGLYTGGIQGH